jgi:TolB protein
MTAFWLRLSGMVTALGLVLVCIGQLAGHGIATVAISYTTLFDSPLGHGIILLDINRSLAAKFVKNKMIGLMAWSPEGTQIVFYDDTGLSIMDAFGQTERVLLNLPSDNFYIYSLDWSPDGQYIVLDILNKGTLEIYLVDLDAPNWNHQLIAYPNFFVSIPVHDLAQPVWSPDGQKIAFTAGYGAICTINPDGSGLRQLTGNAGMNITPDWSPDGQQIIYASNENGSDNYELYLIGFAGGLRKQLSTTSFNETEPRWSPDGKYISFTATTDGFKYEPYIMNADGSNIRALGIVADNIKWYP